MRDRPIATGRARSLLQGGNPGGRHSNAAAPKQPHMQFGVEQNRAAITAVRCRREDVYGQRNPIRCGTLLLHGAHQGWQLAHPRAPVLHWIWLPWLGQSTNCTSAATAAIFFSIPASHSCGVSSAIIAMVDLPPLGNEMGALSSH